MLKLLIITENSLTSSLIEAMLPPFSCVAVCGSIGDCESPEPIDAVIIDLGINGWKEALKTIRRKAFSPAIIAMAPRSEVNSIVLAFKEGAYDWLPDPPRHETVTRLCTDLLCRSEESFCCAESTVFNDFLGESSSIKRVKQMMEKYAAADQPILLSGESGTGKGVAAEIIHKLSPRRKGPFCFRNCGAIPPTLIESELFGTKTGSYTGAIDRPGGLVQSDGGSFFLDEIGELPLDYQAKLLRVIEEGIFHPLGSNKPVTVDTRFIAASNRDLDDMVAEKRFREDLFYRLNILPITIPPLRERKEDIPLLASHFLRKKEKKLDHRAMDRLLDYDWPGNIRQLNACLTRAALITESDLIRGEDLLFR
jgi:DNA-binding NtrC family response regulator